MARIRLFQRLAFETTRDIARRRASLAADRACVDTRLAELGRTLCLYRTLGLWWRTPIG